ncbi:uncharacterized protein [Eurosta solidaginis]|uniref:uncharacterized protein n=1 Tax=Eurosta solidaginis TaxID=178769 RepID=UPI0035312C8A
MALDIIRNKWTIIKEHTNMPKQLFMDILKFCIEENRYFKFNDTVYTQLRGMPMGSPASPVIADIIMEELLNNTIEKLVHKPRIMTKYVDDLFAIVKHDEIQNTLNALNTFHKNIKFTIEMEEEGKLSYLDSMVIKRDNQLKLIWYKKPTASGRLINFYSKHPKSMIMNTAMSCIRRMLQISDDVYHQEIRQEIFSLLKLNDFPENIIRTLIRRSMCAERLIKSNCYNNKQFRIAHKPCNTLKNMFNKTKSIIPPMEKSNVIYKIPCNGNNYEACRSIYVGTTKSKLKTRIAQHKSDMKHCHNLNNQKTALTAHCASSGHCPNFEKASVLQQQNHYRKRLTLEMLHIIHTPPDIRLNFKTDTINVAHLYRHLLTTKSTVQNSTPTRTDV